MPQPTIELHHGDLPAGLKLGPVGPWNGGILERTFWNTAVARVRAVPEAVGLGRATLRTNKQNVFWAFFYNAVGVPLAALGFMSPVLCAAAAISTGRKVP